MQTFLQQGRKRHRRPLIAFIVADSLTFHDTTSNCSFLVDTGAEVSILHATTDERLKQPMLRELLAANGSTIKCYGEQTLHIHVSTCTYLWKFLVAVVKRALLGADFMTHSSLLVDVQNRLLVHPTEFVTLPLLRTRHPPTVTGLAFVAAEDKSKLSQLLDEFQSITKPKFNVLEPKHAVRHVIETTVQPIRAKARPLPLEKLAAAKAKFANMFHLGIVQRSNSPWSSPLHVVRRTRGVAHAENIYVRMPLPYPIDTPCHWWQTLAPTFLADGKVDFIRGNHQVRRPRTCPKDCPGHTFRQFQIPSYAFPPKKRGPDVSTSHGWHAMNLFSSTWTIFSWPVTLWRTMRSISAHCSVSWPTTASSWTRGNAVADKRPSSSSNTQSQEQASVH